MAVAALASGGAGTAQAVDVADASTLESIPAVSPVGLTDAVEEAAQKPTSLVADVGGKSTQTVLPEVGKVAHLV